MVNQSTSLILFKSLMRALKKNIKQLISIVAISFLCICLFAGLTSNAYNLRDRQDSLYAETNLGDGYITTTGLTDADRTAIDGFTGISAKEERIYLSAVMMSDSVYIISTDDTPTISHPIVTAGEEGFLLMNTFLTAKEVNIGDTVEFSLSNPIKSLIPDVKVPDFSDGIQFITISDMFKNNVIEGKENIVSDDEISLYFTITGTMYHPEGVQNSQFSNSVVSTSNDVLASSILDVLLSNYNETLIKKICNYLAHDSNPFYFIYGYKSLTRDDMVNALSSKMSSMANQVVFKSDDADSVLDQADAYFNSKSEDAQNLILAYRSSLLPSYQALEADVDQSLQMTFVFPVLFFLVSLLVIITTLSQMILKSRSEIGVMKAVGVPKIKIYLYFIVYGFVVCFIGGVLGFITGPLIIPQVMGIKYNLLWDLPKVGVHFFYPLSVLMFLALLATAALCSFLLSFSVIREKAADTLRPKVVKPKRRQGNNDSFYSRHTSLEMRMAIRNIFKNKTKSIMVVLGMMGCTALMVSGFGITDTIDHDIQLDYSNNQRIELTVVPLGNVNQVYNDLLEIPNVQRVEKITQTVVTVTGQTSRDVTLNVLEENSSYFKVPYYVDGGVTIDMQTSEKIGVEVGDTVKVVLNGKIYDRTVTNIFQSSTMHGLYDLAKAYDGSSFVATSFNLDLIDESKANDTKAAIELLDNIKVVQTNQDIMDYADNLLSSVDKMTNVIKIFAICLCVVVIYNLTSLNITERKRDIATLKVLGFHYGEINKTLTYELAIDCLVGGLLGCGLGYPLTVLIMIVNRTELLTFIYHVNWYTYLIGFGIAFVTSIVVSLILNLKTRNIPMAESLKSVE